MAFNFLIQIGIMLVLTVLAELLRPKPKMEEVRPKGLGDFDFPTATEGRAVPLIFGRVMLRAPNVVWFGAFEARPKTKYIRTGLFSGSRETIGFKYHVGVQGALCRGPIDNVHGVWIGEDQLFNSESNTTYDADGKFDVTIDKPDLFGGEKLGGGGFQGVFEFFQGDDPQPTSEYLQRYQTHGLSGVTDTTPCYNGTSYYVMRGLQGSSSTASGCYVGMQASIKPVKFEVARYPGLIPGQIAGQNKIGDNDCNPLNVLYELLTDREWGLGFAPSEIDTTAFIDAAATINDEGLGFSMVIDQAMQAVDFMKELERHIDGVCYINKSTGLWTLKLARSDYALADCPELNEDNVIEVVKFDQGSWAETVNRVDVKFNHRNNDYMETFATSSDSANYLTQGGGTLATGTHSVSEQVFPGVKTPGAAAILSWRSLRALSYPLAKAQFKVNREFWNLNLGDVVKWTDDRFGYEELAMRVTKLDFGQLDKNEITLDAVQDIFEFAEAAFGAPPDTSWINSFGEVAEYAADEQIFEEAPYKIQALSGPEEKGRRASVFGNLPGIWNAYDSRFMMGVAYKGREARYSVNYTASVPSGGPTQYVEPKRFEYDNFLCQGELITSIDLLGDPGMPLNTSGATTILVDPGRSGLTMILEKFIDNGDTAATTTQMGESLAHLIKVGIGDNEEYMLVTSVAETADGNIELTGVYRGILDRTQKYHSAGVPVTFMSGGINFLYENPLVGSGGLINFGDLLDSFKSLNFNNMTQAGVDFRQVNYRGEEYGGSTTPGSATLASRPRRPYPAAGVLYNGNAYQRTPVVDSSGVPIDSSLATLSFRARKFDCTNEIDALTVNDTSVDATTEYRVEVFVDPDGANIQSYDSGFVTEGTTCPLFRLHLINKAAIGTECEVRVTTRHESPAYYGFSNFNYPAISNNTAQEQVKHRIVPQSALQFFNYMGGELGDTVTSDPKTVLIGGTFLVVVGDPSGGGIVEASVNGGAFVAVVAPLLSFGAVAAAAGDTIQLRRVGTGCPNTTFTILNSIDGGYGSFAQT